MKKEISEDIKRILKSVFLKGLLLSIVIFFIAMTLNFIILSIWYAFNKDGISVNQLVTVGILGGLFPVIVYIVLGIVRCAKVFLRNIVQVVILPIAQKSIDQYVTEKKGKIDDYENMKSKITSKVTDKLTNLPAWAKRLTKWLLGKIHISTELISIGANATHEDIIKKLMDYLEESLNSVIDSFAPFWVNLLIPLHVLLLLIIWFI